MVIPFSALHLRSESRSRKDGHSSHQPCSGFQLPYGPILSKDFKAVRAGNNAFRTPRSTFSLLVSLTCSNAWPEWPWCLYCYRLQLLLEGLRFLVIILSELYGRGRLMPKRQRRRTAYGSIDIKSICCILDQWKIERQHDKDQQINSNLQ